MRDMGGTDLALCQEMYMIHNADTELCLIGCYDLNPEKREQMQRPITDVGTIRTADIIYTEERLIESVKKSISVILNEEETLIFDKPDIVSCQEFMRSHLVVHSNAVGNGSGFSRWIVSAMKFHKGTIESFFEIGANYSQDANYVKQVLGLSANKIFCVEANPRIAEEARKLYAYNEINAIVSNKTGKMKIHMVPGGTGNSGLSTVVNYPSKSGWETEEIESIRLDEIMDSKKIEKIDFVKIDVEGMSYEVLEGIGKRINDIGCIQLEAEYENKYEKYSWKDIIWYLTNRGFILIDYCSTSQYQCDSLWINEKHLNVKINE